MAKKPLSILYPRFLLRVSVVIIQPFGWEFFGNSRSYVVFRAVLIQM
jgi:hypothetical protein